MRPQEFDIAGPCAWVWGGHEITRRGAVDFRREPGKDHFEVVLSPATAEAIQGLEVAARKSKRPAPPPHDTCAEHLAWIETKMTGREWRPKPSMVKRTRDGELVLRLALDRIQGRPPSREWLDEINPAYLKCVLVYDGKRDLDYHYKEMKLKAARRTPHEPSGCPYCCHGVGEASDCTCGGPDNES